MRNPIINPLSIKYLEQPGLFVSLSGPTFFSQFTLNLQTIYQLMRTENAILPSLW